MGFDRHRGWAGLLSAAAFSVAALAAPPPSARESGPAQASPAARPEPGATAVDTARLSQIDRLIEDGIAAGHLPGAVVVVGHDDKVAYEKAFGRRASEPAAEAMTLDTIFDLASLTKVVATTPSVMRLVEDGRLRLTDRASAYIPGLRTLREGRITIRHLLTHMSGLRPDVDLADEWGGSDAAIRLAVEEVPVAAPDRADHLQRHQFLRARRDRPPRRRRAARRVRADARLRAAGDAGDMFLPPASLAPRIAPTERCTRLGWPCAGPERRCCAASCTIRRRGGWVASPDTPGCSRPRAT